MKEIFERGNMVITRSPVSKNYTWHISRFPAMKSDPEGMIELADAIYKAEGIDLRAANARLEAENERLRENLNIILVMSTASPKVLKGFKRIAQDLDTEKHLKIWIDSINSVASNALSPSTDESEEADD